MLQKEIRNIVFDLGGVLCGLDAQRCVEAFHRIGAQRIAYYVEEHRLEAELGTITTGVFCDRVRSIVGQPLPDDDIVWAWNELLTGVSSARLEAICRLAGKYRLFLLSNTNVMHWAKCKEEYFKTSVNGILCRQGICSSVSIFPLSCILPSRPQRFSSMCLTMPDCCLRRPFSLMTLRLMSEPPRSWVC